MIVYLNDRFIPLADARISPLDRGFLFGDGVYEVIPVYRRRLFRIEQHLQRLQDSLDSIHLSNPHAWLDWQGILQELVDTQVFEDQSLYLQVTRGADNQRNHAIPQYIDPTVFIFASPLPDTPKSVYESGVAVISGVDNRWQRCDIKAIDLLANILLYQQAVDAHCAETILLRDGYVLEGSASNVFIVQDGVLRTPPKGPFLLPGVTRDLVLEIAQQERVPLIQGPLTQDELTQADEIWITSSTKEIWPVTQLDGQVVGEGKPGAMWRQFIRCFAALAPRANARPILP